MARDHLESEAVHIGISGQGNLHRLVGTIGAMRGYPATFGFCVFGQCSEPFSHLYDSRRITLITRTEIEYCGCLLR